MPGLFSTPDEVAAAQQAQQQAAAAQYAQLGGLDAGPYLGFRAGQQLGGLLSGPDPARTRAVMVQKALTEMGQSGEEMGSQKYFQALSKKLADMGDPVSGLGVHQYGTETYGKQAKANLEAAQAKEYEAKTKREEALLNLFGGLPGATPTPGTSAPIRNPDGTVTTERSITVEDKRLNGGKPTNIPSVWGGKVVSDDEAISNAAASKTSFPAFDSIGEAVSAAKARSDALGTGKVVSVGGASGAPGQDPLAGVPPALRDPNTLRAYGILAQRPEFVTHAERIEKQREMEKTLTVARDPETGLFSTLFDDPFVGKQARQAQKQFTEGKLDYANAQQTWKYLTEKATTLAAAKQSSKEKIDQALFSPDALKIAALEKLYFGTEPRGLGAATAAQKRQVADERARLATAMGLTPLEAAMMPQDNRIKMKAVDSLTKWGATVARSSDKLERDLQVAIDYAEKMGPGRVQALNKAFLAGRKEFNDPVANAYVSAINSVRTEYGRMMVGPTSNGMLPVEALKKGNELISTGVDVPSLKEVGVQMRRDATNTILATNDQISSLRGSIMSGGKTPSFSGASETGQFREGQTASDDKGNKIIFRSGQWQPIR